MATTEEQLKKFLQDIAKKENYLSGKIDVKPISSAGANFTADLFLVTISEPLKPDINIFAKVANLNEESRKRHLYISKLYETETLFYSELVVNYEKIYDKHQVPAEDRLILPKCYGCVQIPYEEILTLENLEARGFGNFDRLKIFGWEYASTSVTQIAKFHAIGLAFREESPEEFERITSHFMTDIIKNQETLDQYIQLALANGSAALSGDVKKRLVDYLSSKDTNEAMSRRMTNYDEMLIHADFRPSNLMHRRRNGKLEIITLDFQTLRIGNPIFDLLLFIYSGSDEEFRRLHYQRLLEHYFTELTRALQQVNVDVEKVYPRTTFEAHMDELKPLGLIIGLIVVGMITADEDQTPTLEDGITGIHVTPNKIAKERIGGVVREYIKWGVL